MITDVDAVLRVGNTMDDTDIHRRTFLKKSAVGAVGFTSWANRDVARAKRDATAKRQDEREQYRYTRRMAFEEPDVLSDDWRDWILLLTGPTDDAPEVSDVAACEFSDWPPDQLAVRDGLLVDVENIRKVTGFFRTNPDVRAEQLVERNRVFVDQQRTPVPLGTPFVVNDVVDCPGEYLGVTAIQLPGIDIKTGPGVSTGE